MSACWPPVALAVPRPACVRLSGPIMWAYTRGPRSLGHPGRCLAGRSTARWVGCSPSAGWTGPGCRALVREGRLVAGLAVLWAPVRPPQSPRSSRPEAGRRPFADPEDWRWASSPERKWRRGRPRTGSGKAAEGGSGRGAPGGARPPAGAFPWEVGGRAGLWRRSACVCVCACARMCSHVRTHPRAGLGALSAPPGGQVNRFPARNTAGTGGQDLMRWCAPPARL